MNKGLNFVNGEYVIFMNSGDHFFKFTTLRILNDLIDKNFPDILYGNHIIKTKNSLNIKFAKNIKNLWKGSIASHQSMIFRSILLTNRNFNLNYTYASDYDLFYFFKTTKYKLNYIDEPISIITTNGFSEKNSVSTYKEFFDISLIYSKNKLLVYIYFFYKILERTIVFKLKNTINV